MMQSMELHPLQNPVILDNLMKVSDFSFDDLSAMRLVCSEWHNATLAKWRESAVLKINNFKMSECCGWAMKGRLSYYLDGIKITHHYDGYHYGGIYINDLMKRLENADVDGNDKGDFPPLTSLNQIRKKPFRNLKFVECKISVNDKIWSYFGPHVEHIKFVNCTFENGKDLFDFEDKENEKFMEMVNWFRDNCPNFKSLNPYLVSHPSSPTIEISRL